MGSILNDDDDTCLAGLSAEGEAFRAVRMRATAGDALWTMDANAKYRRALLRAPVAANNMKFIPGTQV